MTADVVLLDLDGTVLDTHDLILASWAHVKQAFGIEADDEAFRLGIGRPLEQVLGPFVPPGLDVATLAAAYRAHNDLHHDEAVRPFPGMREVFDALRARGVPIGIVTSKSKPFAERGLRVTGLRADLVVGPHDAGRPKPAPDPVWHALRALGDVAPARSLFVGDAATDLIAGKAAGVRTGAALWGPFARHELAPHAPDHFLEAPEEILHLARR
jgi:pyrophosphatase PpaX